MSIQAVNWALKVKVGSSSRKFVLLALANFANDMGEAYPSCETLCAVTEQDRKTVLRALAALEESGLIADTGERKGHTRGVPVYRLNTPSEDVPKTEQYQKRNSTESGTASDGKQYQISHEAVPNFPGSSTKNGTQNHQGTIRGTIITTEGDETSGGGDSKGFDLIRDQPLPNTVTDALRGCPDHWHEELRRHLAIKLSEGEVGSPSRYCLKILDRWKRGENPPPAPTPPPSTAPARVLRPAPPTIVPIRPRRTAPQEPAR